MTRGPDAEREVMRRLETALRRGGYRVYGNVAWTSPVHVGDAASDGEADVVIAHAERGILVIEVKSGVPGRDSGGRWWLGPVRLDKSPFDQAKRNKYALAGKIASVPGWPHGEGPIAGHAVAFPHVDLAAPGHGRAALGPDAPPEIVLDASALETDAATRTWVERAFGHWTGDGATRGVAPGEAGMVAIEDLLAPRISLRRRLGGAVTDDRHDLVALSREQLRILNTARGLRRVEVVGPAGSGKSMLAADKARRLAGEGYRTLMVCYNQRLATEVRRDLRDVPQPAGMFVTTFHRLCEQLAGQAGTLPERPRPVPQGWWDETLPQALDAAIDARPDMRYHAIVVDEGQDFAASWLASLDRLLESPGEDVLWVFHDPGQALYRDDEVGRTVLGLTCLELFENHRNPQPVAELASRFYRGGSDPVGYRDGGQVPRVVEAAPGHDTLEAVRKELHRLVQEEGVKPWDIAVLSGRSARDSEVWKKRRFGDVVLGNAALADDGMRITLPPERIADDPPDTVVFETVRRFKGLEAPVVVLVELPDDDGRARLDQLLYVALTRATTALTVITPAGLAARLR